HQVTNEKQSNHHDDPDDHSGATATTVDNNGFTFRFRHVLTPELPRQNGVRAKRFQRGAKRSSFSPPPPRRPVVPAISEVPAAIARRHPGSARFRRPPPGEWQPPFP